MAYKDLLVYLDPTPASAARLTLALKLAAAEGAYLTGVDATTDEAFTGDWRDAASGIEAAFAAGLKAHAVCGEYHIAGAHASLEDFAPTADLLIVPSPSPQTRRLIHPELPDGAVKAAGAPVLVVPTDWAGGTLGRHVVIAWNGDREARRAVRDALPLLGKAESVTIFVFSRGVSAMRASGERLAAHLARHGVAAKVSDWTNTGDVGAIEALFASLDAQSADLLVAGAFGHSRLYESLFGSVSLDLLRQPVLPVLMSH